MMQLRSRRPERARALACVLATTRMDTFVEMVVSDDDVALDLLATRGPSQPDLLATRGPSH